MTALRRTFLIAVCLALPPITALTTVNAAEPETITVFAAASMTDALEKLARQYNESTETRNVKVRFSFAASSTLARQIEAGAPADIFISANEEWMDYLVAKNLIVTATRVSPVGNTLVMIAPADSPLAALEIDRRLDFRALIGPDARIVTGDPANVPVGMYAKKALENLGLWTSAEPLLARADNVRAALALVERGEAPLGIVYETDARASKRVRVVGTFPPESHRSITYSFAIVAGRDTPPVLSFFRYLTAGSAADVYKSPRLSVAGTDGITIRMPFSPIELEALLLSLRVSAVAVVCSLPFALAFALLLARGSFPGKVLIDGLVHLPLVLPPVVMGYLLLITLGTRAPVGAWLLHTFGIRLVFNWTGAAVAAGIVTFPFQLRAMRLALEGVDSGLEAAARSLGASRLDVFCSVTLPLMSPGIIVGAITAFAASLGEFGAIITFVSNVPGETQTLPLAIYSAIQTPGNEAAAARLASLSIMLALAGLLLSELAGRRSRRLIGW